MIAWLDTLADDPREAEFMIWLYHEFKPLMFATAKNMYPIHRTVKTSSRTAWSGW